jgi:hypothetical protein
MPNNLGIIILLLILPIILGKMKKKPKFLHEFFTIDWESPDRYLVLMEILDDKPVSVYFVKMPAPALRCTYYPYIQN